MPNWKKVIISGSNISQLTNDSGYVLADQVSGSSTLPISNLSASLTITDQTISSSVAALSASASTRRDVLYSQLEFMNVSLSGSNSAARNVLADQVSGSSTLPISNLSASLTITDQTISASIAALSGSASDARNALVVISSSYALTASYAHTASYVVTSSYAVTSTTAINANDLIIGVKNTSGETLPKGTPVYSTGVTGENLNISAASASSAATMPAIGILSSTLSNNTSGQVILTGKITGVDTSGFTAGNNIYVAPTGGFTETKPGGDSTEIQNIAIVGKINATEGELIVVGSGRTNDVPNLPTDYIFLGDGNTLEVPLADAITGSLPSGTVSGSVQVDITSTTGYATFSSSLQSTDQAISASIAALSGSASDARNLLESVSASYALTSSYSHTASYAISSSHEVTHEVSSSYAQTATSASYALTASYALNGGGDSGFPAEYVTANTTAEKGKTYVFEQSTAYTLTLPSTPTNGDSIQISNRSNIGTNILGRNGELIMGDASDLTLDLATASFILTYAGGTQGWVIIGAGGGATTGSAASIWYDGGTFISSSVDVRITGSLSMVGSEANFETLQVVLPQISQSGNFADDTAAAIGGIALGGLYRNGNLIAIRLS